MSMVAFRSYCFGGIVACEVLHCSLSELMGLRGRVLLVVSIQLDVSRRILVVDVK